MYRTLAIAIITLGAIALPVDTSLAFGNGGEGHFGRPMVSVGFAAQNVPSRPGGGAATPFLRKLSPKAAGACYRACMHGMDSSWDNFCGYSCY
jgi:hypothetical protein